MQPGERVAGGEGAEAGSYTFRFPGAPRGTESEPTLIIQGLKGAGQEGTASTPRWPEPRVRVRAAVASFSWQQVAPAVSEQGMFWKDGSCSLET